MANQFLALSMFIMLLSFFIVLNSLSNFEVSKSSSILNSLSSTFSKIDVTPDLQPSVEESPEALAQKGDALAQLSDLFQAEISGVDVQKNRLGTQMRLRLDLAEFEKNILVPVQAAAQSDGASASVGGKFLPTLISLFETQDSVPYRMDMVVNLDDNPAALQNESPDTLKGQTRKVAMLADALERAGLPQKRLSAGVGQGEEGKIDLYFSRYEALDSSSLSVAE